MIERIKNKIWDLLKEKEVSLAMLFDSEGKIVWSKGREVKGKNIREGKGFSRTFIEKSLCGYEVIRSEGVMESVSKADGSDSVCYLHLKSLLILPVADTFFLYIDSGTRETFSEGEFERFRTLGELLGDTINQIRKNESDKGGITGISTPIQQIRNRAVEYSLIDEPVFLRGETGTGKNHIAELLHNYSGRSGKFVVVNTPGIPENLFENEMFGHMKGAFTDAAYDRSGLVREAEGGTLFIDEVTEVPMSVQAKLLRFVETKKYNILGESCEKTANVRIVAATNKDIEAAIANKVFREDLYYRLNILEIQLPPLRERKEDIRDLVIDKVKFLNGKKMGKGFWDALSEYDWPGNIRELITVLKRAGVVKKETIEGKDIKEIIYVNRTMNRSRKKGSNCIDKVEGIWDEILSGRNFWEVVKAPYLDRELNRSEVKEILERGLTEANGKYVRMLDRFNLEKREYKNFMRFLYENKLR